MVPRAVLMKSGLVSLNTARQVNTAHPKITINSARPMSNLSKTSHSTVKRPINKNTTFKNRNFNQRVNTVKDKNVNTVRPKAVVNAANPKAIVNAARPKAVVNAIKGNNVNAVKASACEDLKTMTKVCRPYYEEIDGRYVAFAENPKGGKITRKCIIKTGDGWFGDGDDVVVRVRSGDRWVVCDSFRRSDDGIVVAMGVDIVSTMRMAARLEVRDPVDRVYGEAFGTLSENPRPGKSWRLRWCAGMYGRKKITVVEKKKKLAVGVGVGGGQ
ncbi:hypothetical protein Tco_0650986 [Tanacetum coccineum]